MLHIGQRKKNRINKRTRERRIEDREIEINNKGPAKKQYSVINGMAGTSLVEKMISQKGEGNERKKRKDFITEIKWLTHVFRNLILLLFFLLTPTQKLSRKTFHFPF